MDESTLNQLKRLGHQIGQTRVRHDGTMLIAIDGKMLTYKEIDELLANESKERDFVNVTDPSGQPRGSLATIKVIRSTPS
jgi:hypothetical protein